MNRKTALPLSIGIHILLALGLWQLLQVEDSISEAKPQKILVTLQNFTPQPSAQQPMLPEPIKPAQQSPSEQKPIISKRPEPLPKQREAPTITPSRPIPTAPAPAKVEVSRETVAESVKKSFEPITPVITSKPALPPPPEPPKSYTDEHLGTIRTILQERLVYPKMAIKLRQQGEVKMSFYLSPGGEVSDISVESPSGFSLLDGAAEKLIRDSAAEFPKPRQKVRISIPIGYRLR